MKYIILLITLTSLFSCEEETYCFECTTTEISEDGSKIISEFNRCGITDGEAGNIERDGSVMIASRYRCCGLVEFTKKTDCVKTK